MRGRMAGMDYGFSSVNLQGVKSDCGFTVQFTDRDWLEYRAGGFLMKCFVELGASVAVPPLPFGNLTPELHAEIVERISAALAFMNAPERVVRGKPE
jgi:hypothetical protein